MHTVVQSQNLLPYSTSTVERCCVFHGIVQWRQQWKRNSNSKRRNYPYTYSWSPSVGALPTIVDLEAGSYQVTVSDANACTQNATVTITEPAMLLSSVSTSVPVLCHGWFYRSSTLWMWVEVLHLILICGQAVEASSNSGPLPAGAFVPYKLLMHGDVFPLPLPTSPNRLHSLRQFFSPVNVELFRRKWRDGNSIVRRRYFASYMLVVSFGGTSANASSLTANTYTVTVSDANNCQNRPLSLSTSLRFLHLLYLGTHHELMSRRCSGICYNWSSRRNRTIFISMVSFGRNKSQCNQSGHEIMYCYSYRCECMYCICFCCCNYGALYWLYPVLLFLLPVRVLMAVQV